MPVLPGLLTLGAFGLLCLSLRRWYDAVPWRIAALACGVVTLLFGRALFLGAVLLPLNLLSHTPPWQDLEQVAPSGFVLQADQVQDLLPYHAQTRALLARGEWPLLSPVGAGEPLLGNAQAQHFNPLRAVTYLVPLPSAPGVEAALKLLVAFTFTFLLLRRVGAREPAAVAGGLVYALSSFLLLYLGWPQTQSAAALPLVLYATELTLSRAAPRDAVLLALALATLILGGHPETIVYVLGTASLFGCERWWRGTAGLGSAARARRLLPAAVATVLALGAVTPVLLPSLDAIGKSKRQLMVDIDRETVLERRPEAASEGALAALVQRTLPIVAPLTYGSERYGRSWGFSSILQDGSAFAGTAALVLLLAGLAQRRGRLPGEVSLGVATLGSLIVFVQPPGLVALMKTLPILSQSGSENRRLAMIVCFGIAYLAAGSWHRIVERRRGVGAGVVAGLAIALCVQWAYSAHPNPANVNDQLAARTGAQLLQISVAMALVVVLLAIRWQRPAPAAGVASSTLSWSVTLLVFFELYPLHGPLNAGMPRSHFFPQRPSIELLQRRLGDDRIAPLGGVFQQNYPLVFGLADIRSGNPLQPADLMRVTGPLHESFFATAVTVADHPLLDLLGVRYVVTKTDEQLEEPLQRIFEGNVAIWERPHPLPRLFLARSARRLRDGDWRQQVWSVKDFVDLSLVSSLPSGRRAFQARGWRRSQVRDLRIHTDRISAEVHAERRQLLASSVYQDGGWRLLRDGVRADTVRTNGAFVGAWLPRGDYRLDLVYRPPGFVLGCILSALAIAIGLALSTAPRSVGRP